MSIIKCKMCGGDLEIIEGASVAECEYCGSMQTVPKVDDEKKLTLFGRANRLRAACEFDKAAGIYEAIVADFPEEAEAYWGLLLCKYGIEYVDDPTSGKKIPTCHRSSFESILDDSDFEQALENADSAARKVYREGAKTLEEIRKGIVAVSNNEQPYDIFICYKETDEKGDRTLDSVLAQDVYDALTDKGYRVFFSRISLEDKLGMEYEPYIFAALNSAKIMLVFGTDYEYFNAVWVKNEWSRFLKLMAKDKEKHLIPCFKGIDAYDMPKEFAKLQAQDMGKVGAIQDLLRGIEKLLPRHTETVKETVVVQQASATQAAPLLQRAFMFLEDGDWSSADEYCEKVLDMDPENAQAYLGKLMAELKVKMQENLKDCQEPFDNQNNYIKAIRFADAKLKGTLAGYIEYINTRNENERIERAYQQAKKMLSTAKSAEAYKKAAQLFESIAHYLDAAALARHCREKAYQCANLEAEEQKQHALQKIGRKKKFIFLGKIALVSIAAVALCLIIINTVVPYIRYTNAESMLSKGQYVEASELFASLKDYEDAPEQAIKARIAYLKTKGISLSDEGYILYGSYEQDNHTETTEAIEWLPLAISDDRVLLISRYALDYDCDYLDLSWLNTDFYEKAFTTDEKKAIIETKNDNPKISEFVGNHRYKISGYLSETKDRVFALSMPEVVSYFGYSNERFTKATPYAIGKGAYVSENGNTWWQLRPNNFVGAFSGFGTGSDGVAMRPAMWIDLNQIP